MYLVTNSGFVESPPIKVASLEEKPDTTSGQSVLIQPDQFLAGETEQLLSNDRIVIEFGSFADGRGFSLAKRLRNSGFKGKIRARGNMFCEQYRYLLDCGFDEIEITPEQALRQPYQHWKVSNALTYRDKLKMANRV
jgi:uncharacterized protein (DUF934 family)